MLFYCLWAGREFKFLISVAHRRDWTILIQNTEFTNIKLGLQLPFNHKGLQAKFKSEKIGWGKTHERGEWKSTWACTKWNDRKWMTDPIENLLLTLVTTNLDFPAVQFNHFLGKYSTGKKYSEVTKRHWFLSTNSVWLGKDKCQSCWMDKCKRNTKTNA